LDRLDADWRSGAVRFDRADEMLLAVYVDEDLVGIGGLTMDPAAPGALRVRRVFFRKRVRRGGIGSRLAMALLKAAAGAGRPITVNAAAGSARFWQSLGFVPDASDGHTHVLCETTP